MLSRLPHALARLFGHGSVESRTIGEHGKFQIYQYNNVDGSFDYEKYKRIQIKGNRKKLDKVWVREENVFYVSNYIRSTLGNIDFGICHGTRRGKEQEWFRKYLHCKVVGTEISDTAEDFPFTIQWDFHDTKSEWIDSVDFIYSNAFDHSYDPEKCLITWMSCVREGGICILEHTSGHELATKLDPFGTHISQMPHLIKAWGKGRYMIRETLTSPLSQGALRYTQFIIVQRYY